MSKSSVRGGVVVLGLIGGLLGLSTSAANHGFGVSPDHVNQLLDAAWTWVASVFSPVWRRDAGGVLLPSAAPPLGGRSVLLHR